MISFPENVAFNAVFRSKVAEQATLKTAAANRGAFYHPDYLLQRGYQPD
jgi:hypothetical protein